jgi:hypothetical protein
LGRKGEERVDLKPGICTAERAENAEKKLDGAQSGGPARQAAQRWLGLQLAAA